MQRWAKRDEESCLDGMSLELNIAAPSEGLRKGYSKKKDQFKGCAGKCSKIRFMEKEISDCSFFFFQFLYCK